MNNRDILKALIIAKNNYKITKSYGMCYHLSIGLCIVNEYYDELARGYRFVHTIIPEFNPNNFKKDNKICFDYWWSVYDKKSRIKAFNKLIKTYRKKVFKEDKLFWFKSFFI